MSEILYQVAPMCHFNLDCFEKIKARIKLHTDVFKKTHSYSCMYSLEDFEFLSEDRYVQKTRFGSLEMVANFRRKDFDFKGTKIPARSILLAFKDSGESFVYRDTDLEDNSEDSYDVSALVEKLSSGEWKDRISLL